MGRPKGGHQGCAFGAVYAIALIECHKALQTAGVTFHAKQHVEVPWSNAPAKAPKERHACDATYVDDEALILLAKSPRLLDEGIEVLLNTLVGVFRKFGLSINWALGKTEIMLRYRGTGATDGQEMGPR